MNDDISLQQRISDELMFEAEAAVRRVKGVKAIAQELAVLPPNAHQTEDDQIAGRAIKLLAWDVMVPDGRISVSVEHGIVALEGEVDWQYQRAAAEADLCKLGGVKGVVNKITVRPRVKSSDIDLKIREALERHAEVEASRIAIRVDDGKVILSGKVHSDAERREIERAAWSAAGVADVQDRIVVA